MSALDRSPSRFAQPAPPPGDARQPAPATWSYTLAYADTPLRALALSEDDLRAVVATLRARNLPLPAELAATPARRAKSPLNGARYIWGFASLRDALQVARAIRRSDYHAYPEPATLREDSLDRLYRRFPLAEFPRASVILFSGTRVCLDPLLAADPAPGSLAADLPDALGPTLWERFTLLGLRLGASLIRVTTADRWVRLAPRALEDAWASAERTLVALAAPDAPAERGEPPARPALLRFDPEEMEVAAFQALLCAVTNPPPSEPPPSAPHPARRPNQRPSTRQRRSARS